MEVRFKAEKYYLTSYSWGIGNNWVYWFKKICGGVV